jgi:hypothetical protein
VLLGRLGRQESDLDLEASEMAIRAAMHEVGGMVLEKLLNSAGGDYQGAVVQCTAGHEASFVDYRSKAVTTVLGAVNIKRAYYYCDECRQGVLPRDEQLDIMGTSFSPGVRRLMGRVGGKESFNEGREDLEELAGIKVKTKAVERIAEGIGEQLEVLGQSERAQAVAENVVPLKSLAKLYISFDGTGVPVVKRETAGRRGKAENGEARTREVKLGCVFTQTGVDEKGLPQRDETSTTYVGAIEPASAFGWRIYGEAARRGLRRAAQVIVIGDGAPWVWGIADEHFPGATQIVDLYHAREHLAALSKLVYGLGTSKAKHWSEARLAQLDAGEVAGVLLSMRRLRPAGAEAQEQLRKTIHYFENNGDRMRYAEFRRQQLFVGSGVIEAGCKTIVGQRLKRSGMRWSLRGANAIIALRCAQLSGRWEEFWETRAAS